MVFSLGLKNEFEPAVENEPPVFESPKLYIPNHNQNQP